MVMCAAGLMAALASALDGDHDATADAPTCTVCQQTLGAGDNTALGCGHVYHTECIQTWAMHLGPPRHFELPHDVCISHSRVI